MRKKPHSGLSPLHGGNELFYDVSTVCDPQRLARLPICLRVLCENVLQHVGVNDVDLDDLNRLVEWQPDAPVPIEVPFHPGRVLMQDYTGIPSLVDLAVLRDGAHRMGLEPLSVNPQIPVDLIIDHSLMVDFAGRADAVQLNLGKEFERNSERFSLAKWAQNSFDNMRVVPPGSGILHQINIEHIASVAAQTRNAAGEPIVCADTMVGTDSHSTMVNGIGVLGWGVGGIEAEAVVLGLPLLVPVRRVIGVRLTGALREGTTTTDLVLTLTQRLRNFGVVDAFVEFHGPALDHLTVADRATVANMAPEYGSTCAFFPVDDLTLQFLVATGRSAQHVARIEAHAKAQGLWRDDARPITYSAVLSLDLGEVEPSVAGPSRPHARVALKDLATSFDAIRPLPSVRAEAPTAEQGVRSGSVVLAAITSCTNTSNPSVMLAAGLLARKAVQHGLRVPAWVKTSLTPGSRVVADYLLDSGLQSALDSLGFQVAGFGCGTCGGNSGDLSPQVQAEIKADDLTVCSVLSGNRNFEARIHPLIKANYLMSPPLVVAFALAGRIDLDLDAEPIGRGANGRAIYLRDIWPTSAEIEQVSRQVLSPKLFVESYAPLFDGDERWNALTVPQGTLFPWDPASTYIRRPPYLDDFNREAEPGVDDVRDARVLVMLGDSVTTDHISPVGAIAPGSPAARYLESHGVPPVSFNAYGSRRSNHEVMVRGTFANIRLRNEVAPGSEGGVTRYAGSGEPMSIFDAATRYRREGVPLVVVAGKDYGAGSSRDWAAKGTRLLGVRAVIAEGFERIHRSNLINMGVLPLQFASGVTRFTLGLDGTESIDLIDMDAPIVTMRIVRASGEVLTASLRPRLDTANERAVWRQGGMMPFVMRRMCAQAIPA